MSDHTYSDEEFVSVFGAMFDINITVNDIKQCKPNFVQKIYVHFLRDCGANVEQIYQGESFTLCVAPSLEDVYECFQMLYAPDPTHGTGSGIPFNVCDSIQQHPESYRDMLKKTVLAKVIRWVLKIIYDDDSFTPADLFDPKPKRARRFFSLLLDFGYVCNELTGRINSIEEQVSIKHEAKVRLCEKIEKLKDKVRQLKMEDAENQICEEQELVRIGEVKVKLQECQETKVNLKSNMDALKMVISTLVTAIKDAELEGIEDKEKVEKLASQVVLPSEYQEIEEREHKVSSYKNENQGKNEHFTDLKQSLNAFNTAVELLTSQLLVLLQEIKQEIAKKKECMDEISRLDRSKVTYLEEAEDKTMQIQLVNERLVSQQEKVSQMHQAWNLKRVSILEEINQQKLVLQEMRHNQTEDEIVSQDLETECLRITKEIQEFNEQIVNMDRFVASSYKKIIDAMEKHNNELQVTFADLAQCIEQCKPKH